MSSIISLFILPLMIVNIFGGIVSGVWLIIEGHWSLVLTGISVSIFAPFLLGLFILAGIIFSVPGIYFISKDNWLRIGALPFFLINIAWIFILMGGWSLLVFTYFIINAKDASLLPILIWSYSIAVGPWSYMAQQDAQTGNDSSTISLFFLQIASFVMFIMTYFHFKGAIWVFLMTLGVGYLISIIMVAITFIIEGNFKFLNKKIE